MRHSWRAGKQNSPHPFRDEGNTPRYHPGSRPVAEHGRLQAAHLMRYSGRTRRRLGRQAASPGHSPTSSACGAPRDPAGLSPKSRLAGGWPTTPVQRVSCLNCRPCGTAAYGLVDPEGFEPSTFSMPLRRAPNCAMGPSVDLEGFEPSTSSVRLRHAPNCATGPYIGANCT